MVTVHVRGTRKYGNKSYEHETYPICKIKANVICTEDGVILTITDMKKSKLLEKIF